MPPVDLFRLRPLAEIDLETIRQWRNSDRVRLNMYADHIITPEEHRRWYDRIKDDPRWLYLIMEYDGQPAGVVNFRGIASVAGSALWGFYLGRPDLPRGSGTVMGYLALNQAFMVEGWQTLSGEVLDFNEPSLRLFRRLGFDNNGRRDKQLIRSGRLVDVVLFTMTAGRWLKRERPRVEALVQKIAVAPSAGRSPSPGHQ